MPSNFYDIIIDKGCLDCILSEPNQEISEEKFISSLKEINKMMLSDNGKFYYFSSSKPDRKIGYLSAVFNGKIEIEEISMVN